MLLSGSIREGGDPLTEPKQDSRSQGGSRLRAFLASEVQAFQRLSPFLVIAALVGLVVLILSTGLLPPVLFLPLLIGGLSIYGSLLARRRAATQNALLTIMAIAAEKRMPLAPAVAAFASQYRGRTRRRLIMLAELLNSGVSLSRSIRSAPKLLPGDAALLARFGEENGVLPQALRAGLAARSDFLPAASSIASRITYLLVVLLTMQSIGIFLSYFILPKFEAIFKDFNIPLPDATRLIADLFYSRGWLYALAVVLVMAEVVLIIVLPLGILGWSRMSIPGLGRFFRR
jgi:type II secretory pathway component PulF